MCSAIIIFHYQIIIVIIIIIIIRGQTLRGTKYVPNHDGNGVVITKVVRILLQYSMKLGSMFYFVH
jgi:hypothetical protein